MGHDFEELANQIEAVFWIVVAVVVAIGGWRSGGRKRLLGSAAAGLFVLFGLSDFVEARTGAWWTPWWLLVWKGLCLVGLLACLILHTRMCPGPGSPKRRTGADSEARKP